jgi:hypothetical protein
MHRQASNAAIGTLISERQFRQKMGFANGSEEKAAVKAAFSFFMKIGIRLILFDFVTVHEITTPVLPQPTEL